MGNNMDEMEAMDNIIILNDEAGNAVKFEFLDIITYENENYVILLPTEDQEADEVVILRLEEVEGHPDLESYVSVEDEQTLNAGFEIFKEKFKNAFNFIEEDE